MPLGATETYTFRPIGGQFVDIVLPRQGILTLCEVEVFAEKEDKGSKRNLALGHNAVQSSTYEDHATAEKATDGNKESVYKKFSCTHTKYEQNPWWRVDLMDVYQVTKVVIANRGDCCEERINGAQIRVGHCTNNNGNNNQLAEVILSIPLGGTKTFVFQPISGRYVNIYLPGDGKILTLCEVELYAD
ncbi:fucolectin-like [Myxocyprinus asiaticus]|uniref:fucolectin-like n=1 Tax=Myxocyprinus asiaticus TaxID=70543 RepID=UPI0022235DF7|nr:fucolectin-like [Myxocyprinus asiaticus]